MKLTIMQGNVFEQLPKIPSESIDLLIKNDTIINTNTLNRGMCKSEYLAGIIDGEGCIYIKKSTYRLRNPKYNDCINPSYSIRLQVKMNDERVLQILKNKFGGTLYKEKRIYISKLSIEHNIKTNRLMWVWQCGDRNATKALKKLLPFLIIKKEQAKNALKLSIIKDWKNRKWRTYPKNIIDKMENLYLNGKRLNSGVIQLN